MKPIYFYAPALKKYETDYLSSSAGWNAISVTGTSCAFNCKHCGRRVLEGMADGSTDEKFAKELEEASKKGGIIISGGSTPRGDVPIWKYSEILKRFSKNLTIIAHTGIVKNREIARKFKEAGVKIALLDMVGDDETIRKVLGQPFTVSDYLNSFKYLKSEGMKVVPHVIMGLSKKGKEGDLHAISLLSEVNPDAIIIVGLMPMPETSYSLFSPPEPDHMIEGLSRARNNFDVPVMLGCARPRGRRYLKVEQFAVDNEVDGIAFPEEETIEYAKGKREILLSNACCGNIVLDFLSRVST
ncbi:MULTISPECIES: radical SAM protein [Acidianus]|uniref:Radical SAM protein n=1 Tax=Candidatus Acidianus copahuensis TaxID=1160895 RepID=A0A031LPT8_9CREN|nr:MULTISPECIES: radical SAM protein [Acidianus]EZQ07021.1 radical SAM protein [Candidatus Acidianus copahuensis]NON63580.1 radical SAM protein [Acidianus sp. RZ1]